MADHRQSENSGWSKIAAAFLQIVPEETGLGKHFLRLNLSNQPDSQLQLENEDDAGAALSDPPSASRGSFEWIAEFCNPFEALDLVLEDPRAGIAILLLMAGFIGLVFVVCCFLSAVLETFLGGGPPQSLGLN